MHDGIRPDTDRRRQPTARSLTRALLAPLTPRTAHVQDRCGRSALPVAGRRRPPVRRVCLPSLRGPALHRGGGAPWNWRRDGSHGVCLPFGGPQDAGRCAFRLSGGTPEWGCVLSTRRNAKRGDVFYLERQKGGVAAPAGRCSAVDLALAAELLAAEEEEAAIAAEDAAIAASWRAVDRRDDGRTDRHDQWLPSWQAVDRRCVH
jgi:hypothetical protein